MTKLSAHGEELDRREYPGFRVAVMGDGKILRNSGSGWKLWRRVAEGVDPAEYARDMRAKYEAKPQVFHLYVKRISEAVPLEKRWQLHEAVRCMPSDPDGVWSEMNLFTSDVVDLTDCVELCRLYQAAQEEMQGEK